MSETTALELVFEILGTLSYNLKLRQSHAGKSYHILNRAKKFFLYVRLKAEFC